MSALPRAADALLARLPLYAEDTYSLALHGGSGAALTKPAPDYRLAPAWRVLATLTASDAVFGKDAPIRFGATCTFYAWVLESTGQPGQIVIAIRGTADGPEWVKDALCGLRPHPVAGRVEDGFYSI